MVWAYVDSIRAALSRRPDGSDASGSPSGDELAKAVGRVVAHEVIHAVATEHPHGPGGLMNATLSSRALLEPVLEVSPVCACAAAEGVARLQLGAGPRDGPATDCGEQ
jgi:hypothetical protein